MGNVTSSPARFVRGQTAYSIVRFSWYDKAMLVRKDHTFLYMLVNSLSFHYEGEV